MSDSVQSLTLRAPPRERPWTLALSRLAPRLLRRSPRLVSVRGGENVHIGEGTVFLPGAIPAALACESGAEIRIGEGCVLGPGVHVAAQSSVRMGARCRLGAFVELRDGDGDRVAPIVIGDDVCISHRAIIQPGSDVGDRAIVAAGAVVSGVVPPNNLAIGNPARCVPLAVAATPRAALRRGDARPPPAGPAYDGGAAPPSHEEVRAVILEWLDENRVFGDAAQLVPDDSVSLRKCGLIDSLALVQIVDTLEVRFGVKLDLERVAQPDGQSIRAFAQMVAEASRS